MTHTLETAAQAAGLIDMDLLKIADPALAPEKAVAVLQGRYPAAFVPREIPNACTMSDADYRAAKQKLDSNTHHDFRQAQDKEWLKQAEIKYGTRGASQ
ncbi:hypothetical protein Gbfr_007_271 [Gluconobacter frateurii M-2]|nr:hypothetical protein Gbfr_007_271 [Gluconobacter frateurii M-2]